MEFKTIKLGDIANVKNGYAYKSKDFIDNGVPIIKIKNISPPLVNLEGCNYVSEELYIQTLDYELVYGDILISMTGSGPNQMSSAVGKVGRYRFNKKALQNQRVGKIEIIDEKKYDKDFLYYYLSQKSMLDYFVNNSTGSANQANISKKIIENTEVPNFSIEKQNKIKKILDSLDKKIEVNNKIIANLEEQAQAIFKSWFVDFEPFQYGNFVESELGMIPEGWEVKKLGDLVENHDRKRKPISKMLRDKMEKKYPYYGANGVIDYVDEYIFNGKYLLVGEDGTVRTKEGYPILNYVHDKFWVSNHAHVLSGKLASTEYIYLMLSKMSVNNIVTGAVQEKINQKNLNSLKTIFPLKNELIKFENIIQPIFKIIINKKEENKKLAEIRDALLPKLMSGEIDVSNIEIKGEEVKNE